MNTTRYLTVGLACTTAFAMTVWGSTLLLEATPSPPAAATERHYEPDSGTRIAFRPTSCKRAPHTISVSLSQYPNISRHVRKAIDDGHPTVLHIDRSRADQRRDASTDDLPPDPATTATSTRRP